MSELGTRLDVEEDMVAKLEGVANFMRDSLGWRVLVLPMQPRKHSEGGIALPSEVQDAEMHLAYIGQIIAVGPLAGKNERFMPPQYRDINLSKIPPKYEWPYTEGDWVTYGRYAGMKMEYRGVKLLQVNDDELTGRIQSPAGWKIYA